MEKFYSESQINHDLKYFTMTKEERLQKFLKEYPNFQRYRKIDLERMERRKRKMAKYNLVIEMRKSGKKMREIGDKIGLSTERIRQIIKQFT